jgi:uncharacterized Zn finger protein (UPF0148 family)
MISKCPRCLQPVSRPVDIDSNAEVICPHCNARFSLESTLNETPPELVAVEIAATNDSVESNVVVLETKADQLLSSATETLDKSATPATEESGYKPSVDSTFDFCESVSGEVPTETSFTESEVPRRRTGVKKTGIIREMVNVFFGGIAGLAITYYALNFFGGSRFDFLSVYLPGCAHTYQYWPDTLLEDWLGGN